MKTQVGINGFGRIGRLVLKAILERADDTLEVVAINDLVDVKQNAHLFKYDSTYGIFDGEVKVNDANNIVINGKEIKVFTERDPGNLPWGDLGVDIVVESTGIFTTAKSEPEKGKIGADANILRGGARSIISRSCQGRNLTVVGVNEKVRFRSTTSFHASDNQLSCSSCQVVNDLVKTKYA